MPFFGVYLLTPAGLSLGDAVPPGLAGLSLLVQGFSLAGVASNGIFASTHAHEIVLP